MQEMAKPFSESGKWQDPIELAKAEAGIHEEKGFSVEELEQCEEEHFRHD